MNLFNSCIDSFFSGTTLTLHKSQRQAAKLAMDCCIVGLYCVTITWQQIFKDSVLIIEEGVYPHVTVERRHLWQAVQRDSDR